MCELKVDDLVFAEFLGPGVGASTSSREFGSKTHSLPIMALGLDAGSWLGHHRGLRDM